MAQSDLVAQPAWVPGGPDRPWKSRGRGNEAIPFLVERNLAVLAFEVEAEILLQCCDCGPVSDTRDNPCGPPRDVPMLS